MKNLTKKILIWYALKKGRTNPEYVQTWNLMPRRWVEVKGKFYPNGRPMLRRAKLRLFLEWLCGILTGHEISETERGYGGGNFIDCQCRWCDKAIKVPIKETNDQHLVDLLKELQRRAQSGENELPEKA